MYHVLAYLVGWIVLYTILLKFNKTRGYEWNARLLACIHALCVCRLVEYNHFQWPWEMKEFGKTSTETQRRILEFTGSYFLFNTFNGLYMQVESAVMHVHHVTSLSAVLSCYFNNASGYEFLLVLWGAEFTNPLLHIRWFLRTLNLHKTTFAVVNELSFVVLFMILRVGFISYLSYHMFFVAENVKLIIKSAGFVLVLVNLIFSKQMILLIRRRVSAGTLKDHEQ